MSKSPAGATRYPEVMVLRSDKGQVVIRNYIPYLIEPCTKEAGHIVSIVVNDSHACRLVRVETVQNGIQYVKTFNKDLVLEELVA